MIVNLIQRDGGITFEKWCKHVCKSKQEFNKIICTVKEIIDFLHMDGVCHGDIHPRNILIDQNGIVSIIDFDKLLVITSRQSQTETPNYHIRDLVNNSTKAITNFPDPQPALRGVTKQKITYKRKEWRHKHQ